MADFKEVLLKGFVDTSNSTSTPLTGGGVFTGIALDISNCGIMFVSVYSDKSSATDGLSIQQSVDGTNWDFTDDYTITAGASKNYSINTHAKYFRIVYTNGSTAQTAFRLQTICKTGTAKPSSHRIKDEIIGDDDAELVKAAITGENGNGEWHNVKVTADGNLTISDNSSGLAIAGGNVTGATYVHKFGNAPDFDTSDGVVTIWDGANDGTVALMNYVYSTTADIDSISSSDAGDTQTVEVQGLDGNYNLVVQSVTLNGQNRVALTTSLIRVFRFKNTGTTNFAGQVYVYVNTALTAGVPTDTTKVRAAVNDGNNQTLMAVYTVPAGYTGYMRDFYSSTAGSSKNSQYVIDLVARPFGGIFQLKHRKAISDIGTSSDQHKYEEPEVFVEKTDIEMRVSATAAGATGCSISAGFDLVLKEN
jgi:hypothetical protein